jgi:deoxyuridine 5'-triphosphate nucleotidohydrolase
MKIDEDYFGVIDSCEKAYLLGKISFNINEIETTNNNEQSILKIFNEPELNIECFDEDETGYVVIDSKKMISDIVFHSDMKDTFSCNNFNIESFIKRNERNFVIEYMKAFFEKHGSISTNADGVKCSITCYNNENLIGFNKFFEIPCEATKMFNLNQLIYSGVNVIDLLGEIYSNRNIVSKSRQYLDFMNLLGGDLPALKVLKINDGAIVPTKANFSDAGHDLTVIGTYKNINSSTILCHTGIKLDIPIGYYVEIVPRSSIIKSGYMLANSIGIIDCAYKGELLVALTKIDKESPDVVFPFKCCQLITRKQVFSNITLVSEIDTSKRDNGGFGSSDKK